MVTVRCAPHAPDPLRTKYREHLGDAIRQIVVTGSTLSAAVEGLAIPNVDRPVFIELLRVELANFEPYNCARYRLTINKTEEWIANGRQA
jgi:hypothetical protein